MTSVSTDSGKYRRGSGVRRQRSWQGGQALLNHCPTRTAKAWPLSCCWGKEECCLLFQHLSATLFQHLTGHVSPLQSLLLMLWLPPCIHLWIFFPVRLSSSLFKHRLSPRMHLHIFFLILLSSPLFTYRKWDWIDHNLNGLFLLVLSTSLFPSRLASLVLGDSKSYNELRLVFSPSNGSEYHIYAHKCPLLNRTSTLVALLSRWVIYEYALI
jgi:hypothetical protein